MITATIRKLRCPLLGAAFAAALVLTTTAMAGPAVGAVLNPRQMEAAGPLKKKCRVVVKKVHGRKKHVRVCTKPKPKPKPVAPDRLAAQLASGIDSAHTDAARYAAILRTMTAIKLGVYDGKTGKALVKGLDTNRYDAYLLGGEVHGIAGALGGAKSVSTAEPGVGSDNRARARGEARSRRGSERARERARAGRAREPQGGFVSRPATRARSRTRT